MATTQRTHQQANSRLPEQTQVEPLPTSLRLMEADGVPLRSAIDVFRFSMALAKDVLTGAISPAVCNAAAHATGRALQVLDLQYRLGNKKMLEED